MAKNKRVALSYPAGTVRKEPIPGRNEKCVCGSGKKFKKCCGAAISAQETATFQAAHKQLEKEGKL